VTLCRGPNRIGPGTCRLSQPCMHMDPGVDDMPCAVGGGELLGRSDDGALKGKMGMLCVRSFTRSENSRECGRVHAGNGEMRIQRATQPSGFRGVELEIGMGRGLRVEWVVAATLAPPAASQSESEAGMARNGRGLRRQGRVLRQAKHRHRHARRSRCCSSAVAQSL
jgi:hypothetical protein